MENITFCVCNQSSFLKALNAGVFLLGDIWRQTTVRNSSSSSSSSSSSFSSSSWWQESEVTLSFKIYFPSISFSRRTLMWMCGGMFSAGAWSKANTTGICALWENRLWSHISSNRLLMVLTWEKSLLFKLFLMHKHREGSGVSVIITYSYFSVKTWCGSEAGGSSLWWGWWCLVRSGLQDSQKTLTQSTFKRRSVLQ